MDEDGEAYYGVLNNDGERLSKADLDADAQLWSVNYSRHVRAQFTQNNDHMCSKTCTKYADQGAPNKATTLRNARQMICRFLFFHIKVFTYMEGLKDKIKRVLRRGKELVPTPYLAETNERNEYGRAMVLREHPFRSSSSDLAQAALQCNVDAQFQDRAVPFKDHKDDEAEPVEKSAEPRRGYLFGFRSLRGLKATLLNAQKAAFKAAFVCDFYITKYHAKAQQILSPALAPLIRGLQRYEAEEAEMDDVPPVQERALKQMRKMMLAANTRNLFFRQRSWRHSS